MVQAVLFMWLNPFKELRKVNVIDLFESDQVGYLYIPPSKFDFRIRRPIKITAQ
ncbi:MAG: hypothetical protein U0M20_07225 [Christensenellales bacterium]|nr:hypothetical protein [Christensenellales bacterium]